MPESSSTIGAIVVGADKSGNEVVVSTVSGVVISTAELTSVSSLLSTGGGIGVVVVVVVVVVLDVPVGEIIAAKFASGQFNPLAVPTG